MGTTIVSPGAKFTKRIGRIASPWTPANLFADRVAYRGSWYEARDLSTLFQDAEGLVPVTAPEQPVGLMLDKSGRGCHIVLENCTLKSANGYFWIEFNGVSSKANFVPASLGIYANSNHALACLSLLMDSLSTYRTVFRFNDGSNARRFFLGTDITRGVLRFSAKRTTFANEVLVSPELPILNGAHVWTAYADFSQGVLSLTRDKTGAKALGSIDSKGISDGANSNTGWLGNFDSSGLAAMRFYGGILLASEHNLEGSLGAIESWMGSLIGLSI
ncbi:hypothetical protein [Stenotrophomonas lactitubi]|uniref:hypothetical protein n=1 Tax=Stenotrophomonas lactitubi TaxID=2045214 RepID=UPI00203FC855|nr:hypothetical protein [Stenotrophomonas lactitubi]